MEYGRYPGTEPDGLQFHDPSEEALAAIQTPQAEPAPEQAIAAGQDPAAERERTAPAIMRGILEVDPEVRAGMPVLGVVQDYEQYEGKDYEALEAYKEARGTYARDIYKWLASSPEQVRTAVEAILPAYREAAERLKDSTEVVDGWRRTKAEVSPQVESERSYLTDTASIIAEALKRQKGRPESWKELIDSLRAVVRKVETFR